MFSHSPGILSTRFATQAQTSIPIPALLLPPFQNLKKVRYSEGQNLGFKSNMSLKSLETRHAPSSSQALVTPRHSTIPKDGHIEHHIPIFPHQKLTCWVSISGTTRFWLWCRLYTIFICCILIKVSQGCPSKTSNKLKGSSESINQLEASIQLCWFHPTPFFCSVVNCPHIYVPYNISIFEFILIHT
jgi:hypothetical protein